MKVTKGRPSPLLDTRVIYCGDNLEQLAKPALSLSNGLPDACIDLISMDPVVRRARSAPSSHIGRETGPHG